MKCRDLATLAAMAFSLGACSAASISCTLIGCISGLFVKFSAPPTGAYHVEVSSAESPTPRTYDCANAAQCLPVVQFQNYQPATAVVTVTYAGRTTQTEVTPVYETQYPNGKACGGACTSATVTVPLP
jgi:hypothetical protein